MLNAIRKRLRYSKQTVYIGSTQLEAIVADSFIKRMIGLMYRDSIADNECMLFIFSQEGKFGIWMKNMLFAIDVIWADSNLRIIDLQQNLQPCKKLFCKTYAPQRVSKYIIELNAGFISKNKINNTTAIRL
ncbi:DUF192 domain-containing protein [Candidatus Marsarchaeota archaeon]|nr:DUF192 domain-containing protein [Candidatus Marsarchaeota archaeon]MCL5404921.1 DUF192 domain-containing protein [Candidatus Marsarchaeota archaeon]